MRVLHKFQADFAACAAAALVVWGAATASSEPAPSPQNRAAAPDTAANGDAAVIASFTGGRITVADMQAAIANKDPGTRARIAAPDGRRLFLEQLVRHDLLVLEAERRGYGYHASVIEAGKRAAIARMVERDLAIDPASIPRADAESNYQANLEKYNRPRLRRASHIELATEAEAKALIAELKGASRERFAKLAGERSHDERTRRQGGELGYFDSDGRLSGRRDTGTVPAELAAAAFALKGTSGLSPRPIARPAGTFSVLLLTGEDPAVEYSFAKVEDTVRAELAQQRHEEARRALVATLEQQWKPEVHPERMAAIQIDVGPPLDQPQGFPAAPPDPRAPARIVEPDGF
jgi:peptidyl-prolyl cis-trans isomerase D